MSYGHDLSDLYEALASEARQYDMAARLTHGMIEYRILLSRASDCRRYQEMASWLRWRDARKEWPAKGCRCQLLVDCEPVYNRGQIVMESPLVAVREYVKRWRYAIGPCECKP